MQLLLANPLLLFFVVASLGYLLGEVRLPGGLRLGPAAVLFVGLAFGALHPEIKLPEFAYQFGLVLFAYTIGLASGPSFFASFGRVGLKYNLFGLTMLGLGAAVTAGVGAALGLRATVVAGLFAGSLTNTPALANVLYQLRGSGEKVLAEPVVGYSVAYPMGVVGMLLAMYAAQRIWHVDYAAEAAGLRDVGATREPLLHRSIRVTWASPVGLTVAELARAKDWRVVFGRLRRGGEVGLVDDAAILAPGDVVTATGTANELDAVQAFLGEPSEDALATDRGDFDVRRIFVSKPEVVGTPLGELHLLERVEAIVTRVRRGDVDFVPHPGTVLELGDRVRVLCPRERMEAVSRFFGDSYRAVAEVDVSSLGLGVALGLLLGVLPIPLPGGGTFHLGFAGGPLLAGLVLGRLHRTGPLVWGIPYPANLSLRQLGIVLFLAGVGTRSGWAFAATFRETGGAWLFAGGALITGTVAITTLWVGYRLLKIPMGVLTGILAGLQTQPAILGFAVEQADNELPNTGYATVYPMATLAKILLAQLLLEIAWTGR